MHYVLLLGCLALLLLQADAFRLSCNNKLALSPTMHSTLGRCTFYPKHRAFSEVPSHTQMQKRETRISIPDALTISRVYSIPVFLGCFLAGYQGTALGIYVVSCFTDFLDGYLARKWNQMSDFGAFLDPVADKLMVATALILLTARFPSMLYVLPVTLIMGRELGVSALREWMAGRGRRNMVEVGKLGKLKTVFQMVATSLLLMVVPDNLQKFDVCVKLGLSKPAVFAVGIVALYTSAVLTLWSGFQYLFAAWSTLLGSNADKPI